MESLFDLEILFGLAILTVIFVRRMRFPSIVGFLLAGILGGPHALGLVIDPKRVEQLAEIGVVLLLFTIGIEFSLKELMRIKQIVFLGGGLQITLTILATTGLGVLLHYPMNTSIFFGFLVALSSTAIILKLLIDSGEIDSPHGKVTLGILIFQDLCVVPLMLFTPILGHTVKDIQSISEIALKALVVVLVAHVASRYLIPWILGLVARSRSRELFLLTILFIGIGTAWLTSQAGLSLALGAFIAGLAISESDYSQQVLGDIMPFRDAFMSLFFISVGMLFDPVPLLLHLPFIAGLIATILMLKILVSGLAIRIIGLPLRASLLSAFALAQIGEFSFVLSQEGLKDGLLSPLNYQIFLAASIATMIMTPLSLWIAEPVTVYALRNLPAWLTRGRRSLVGKEKKFTMSNHVIIAGFGLNGQNIVKILKYQSIPYVIIDTNPFTVQAERKKGEPIIFGDASQPEILDYARIRYARILVIAVSDNAASRRIVSTARSQNSTLHIIARTRYLAESGDLYRLGVNEVVPEEFEASIEILSRILKQFLFTGDDIERCVVEIRKDGYEMLRSLHRTFNHASTVTGYLPGVEIGTFRIKEGSPVDRESLGDGRIKRESGATVLAIKRGDEITANPSPSWTLETGDVVLLLGTPEQLLGAGALFEPQDENARNA